MEQKIKIKAKTVEARYVVPRVSLVRANLEWLIES